MSGALCALVGAAGAGFTASASPSVLTGFGSGSVTTSGGSTVSVSGGVPPYSYDWQNIDGDPSIYATNASGSISFFRRDGTNPGDFVSATFICTVTDAVANTADTDTVSATISGV